MNILSQLQQLVSVKNFETFSIYLTYSSTKLFANKPFYFPYTTNKITQNVQRYSAMELVI